MVYNDGSSESARDYIEPLVQNVEEDMQDLDAFFNEEEESTPVK
jgi:hypothetical protein